ncbi:MAG: monofunctional biosynthetic peptidoglycan transglycosylase [Bacteroidales bacterium]|nr:monofunctional biosynthetic peptidoglycan transglycosylase [Bacteroidales bacterium]
MTKRKINFPKSIKKILKILKYAVFVFFIVSILSVVLFRIVNPPLTPLMLLRAMQKESGGKINKTWVPINNISPNLIQAVVTSEDQNFIHHWGFDFNAIQKVYEINSRRKRGLKGASTISQQTAKNVFLTPSRTWLRKGFEVYFTALIEIFWSKKRIMEVYLNIIELGNGIYGAEEASQYYFHKPAKKLTKMEAASIAAIVPNPRKWSPVNQNARVIRRTAWIYYMMDRIEKVRF